MRKDGSHDHAGESRWKSGAGLAGFGGLGALFKTGLLLKLWAVFTLFRLVHVAFLGGSGIMLGRRRSCRDYRDEPVSLSETVALLASTVIASLEDGNARSDPRRRAARGP